MKPTKLLKVARIFIFLLTIPFIYSCSNTNSDINNEENEVINENLDITIADVEEINCVTYAYQYEKEPDTLNEITNIKYSTEDEFKITWDAVENASYYEVAYHIPYDSEIFTIETPNTYCFIKGTFDTISFKITAKSNEPLKYKDYTSKEITTSSFKAKTANVRTVYPMTFLYLFDYNYIDLYFSGKGDYYIVYYRDCSEKQYHEFKTVNNRITINPIKSSTVYEIYVNGYTTAGKLVSYLQTISIIIPADPYITYNQDDEEKISKNTTRSYSHYITQYKLQMDKYNLAMKRAYERAQKADKIGMQTYLIQARGYLTSANKYLQLAVEANSCS